jgi:hypothetical protein
MSYEHNLYYYAIETINNTLHLYKITVLHYNFKAMLLILFTPFSFRFKPRCLCHIIGVYQMRKSVPSLNIIVFQNFILLLLTYVDISSF